MGEAELIFVADDFGLSEEVNAAILHAHREGVLDGAALMLGQPGTADAVALARATPSLQVGWHLHLNDSTPCSMAAWPWGSSPAAAGFGIGLSSRKRALARREIEAQWRAFGETGLECEFINAHHHLHVHPMVRRMLVEVVGEGYPGWLRWGRPRFFDRRAPGRRFQLLVDRLLREPTRRSFPWRTSSTLWGLDRTFEMGADEVAEVIGGLGGGLHEFMFHPRRDADADTACLVELRGRIGR